MPDPLPIYIDWCINPSTLLRVDAEPCRTHQYGIKVAGAGGIEPPVTVLETVGLPLTDAPINLEPPALQQDFPLFYFLMRRMLFAKFAKLAPLQLIRILFLVFSRVIIPILTYSAFKGDSFLHLLSLSTL